MIKGQLNAHLSVGFGRVISEGFGTGLLMNNPSACETGRCFNDLTENELQGIFQKDEERKVVAWWWKTQKERGRGWWWEGGRKAHREIK